METLFRYAAAGVVGICLMAAAEGVFIMFFNRKLEYMQEIQGLPLNRKSMAMDYEYLEDVEVHGKRQRIEKFGGWSLLATMLSILNKLIVATVTVIMAVCVVLPMFVRSNHGVSQGFLGSWLMSVLFLAVILLLVWLEFRAGGYFNGKAAEARKQISGYEARSKYYRDEDERKRKSELMGDVYHTKTGEERGVFDE